MLPYLIIAALVLGLPTIVAAYMSVDVRKFLAGAFFVSSGMQLYLYLANVPIPLIGTDAVQTPETSATRAGVHFALFLLCSYSGFCRRPRVPAK